MPTKRPSSASSRPSSAPPRPSATFSRPRPQSSGYAHPYLSAKPSPPHLAPAKRELGLCDLFFVKFFRCFSVDHLPPPDPTATVYQADKSSSTSISVTATTLTATTATTTASKDAPAPAPARNSRFKMPDYNRPPPDTPKPAHTHTHRPPGSNGEVVRRELPRHPAPTSNARDRASVPLGGPGAFAADPDIPRQMFGKVSSLSSLFENDDH